MKVAIQCLSLRSLGKMGCLLGAVAASLPSLLCGIGSLSLAVAATRWLEGWQDLTVSFRGDEIARFDLIGFFHLDGVLEFLQNLTAASVPVLLLAVLGLALIAGTLMAIIIMLTGLAYNLLGAVTGGVVVEMRAVTPKDHNAETRRE